jgi:hypothetical protein
MNWPALSEITTGICSLATAVCAVFAMILRMELSKLRAEISEARTRDREEMREWINGSFMRAKVVEAEIKSIKTRVEFVEEEIRRAA